MGFVELLAAVGDEPVFETGLLLAGDVERAGLARQLSRWVASGRLWQLRRGLYALAPPFQRVRPHPFLVANRLVRGSYVSLQSALAHHGLIPEAVPVVISATLGRPGRFETPLGVFEYRHLQRPLFGGFARETVGAGQEAYVATPAKALADLVYLEARGDAPGFLGELRLQKLDELDVAAEWRRLGLERRPKLRRALRHVRELAAADATGFEAL